MKIGDREIGQPNPCYIIAEISANHNGSIDEALELMALAKESGADAIKIQTYTADTLTIDCDSEYFQIGKGTLWEGKNLYQLYCEAYTPWEWHGDLFAKAAELEIPLFSTPFDDTAVDFLEQFNPPAYKIASFEMVDIPLIRKIASTGRPIIMSTGMGTLEEISEAVDAIRSSGDPDLALLKCTSAYPAPAEEANLRRIPHMAETFHVSAGLSDHTMGSSVAVASIALGACIIEKHFTKSRENPGPDSSFSMEPDEFKAMVDDVRSAEKALGEVTYQLTDKEKNSKVFRRSIFVVEDIKQGEKLTPQNIRVIRPGYGLAPKYMDQVLGATSKMDLEKGTPLDWDHLLK